MTAESLPRVGEVFTGPGVPKLAKVTVGFASTNDVVVTAQTTYAIFNVPAGMMVLDVFSIVNTAFTTSLTANIGDGDDTDGWLATAKVAPTTAVTTGIHKRSTLPTAEAYAGGKVYAAADTIDVLIGGATPAAGQMDVYVLYLDPASI